MKNPKGVTLVEVLVSVFILTIGILSSLLFFTRAMTANDLSRDMTEATTHGEYVLEDMRARPSLANITSTNWVAFVDRSGLTTLPQEMILVSFTNQQANPLDVHVSVGWAGRLRPGHVDLRTELTK